MELLKLGPGMLVVVDKQISVKATKADHRVAHVGGAPVISGRPRDPTAVLEVVPQMLFRLAISGSDNAATPLKKCLSRQFPLQMQWLKIYPMYRVLLSCICNQREARLLRGTHIHDG